MPARKEAERATKGVIRFPAKIVLIIKFPPRPKIKNIGRRIYRIGKNPLDVHLRASSSLGWLKLLFYIRSLLWSRGRLLKSFSGYLPFPFEGIGITGNAKARQLYRGLSGGCSILVMHQNGVTMLVADEICVTVFHLQIKYRYGFGIKCL